MIEANIKFENDELHIDFKGEGLEDKSLSISVSDDVDFKVLVDYLITIIPNLNEISTNFEELPDVENADKLGVIEETINEIIVEFNSSVKGLREDDEQKEDEGEQDDEGEGDEHGDNEEDDLPF